MKRLAQGLLAAVGTVVLLATVGCGSSGRLTNAELIEQGDEICATYKQKTDKIAEPTNFKDLESSTDI